MTFFSSARAQDIKKVYQDSSISIDQDEKPDTTLNLNNLVLPSDSIQRWKDLKEFAYAKYLDSLLKDKQTKQFKSRSGSAKPGLINRFLSSTFLRVLLWTLGAFFVLFILYRLFLTEGVFKRGSKKAGPVLQEAEEEIISGETDFDNLVNQALQNNDYRLAVRYQYLKTLHKLADKNCIELARDKTNFQYVQEIADPDLKNDFASLTLNYEYVWYGEFRIDKSIYQKIRMNVTTLNQKLKNGN